MKHRPNIDLKIAIIYSFNPNEDINDIDSGILEEENNESIDQLDQTSKDFLDNAIQDYNEMFKTNFNSHGDNFQNYYKDVSMRLKNKEIDLLIVINMFLTGFDATTLNTLWVDKWLKMHGLIQAFSRTNRILNSIKKFGYICSFRPLEKRLNEAISLFSDENARGIILIKSFDDYYNGYKNSSGTFEPGYKQLTNNLYKNFPLNSHINKHQEQCNFIKLFGRILQIRNILISFDEFKQKQIFTDRDLQDYLSLYQDIYDKLKEQEKINKVNIVNDLNFEIELLKQIDFNVDYIFNLVEQKKKEHVENKELILFLTKMLESSYRLRSKKQLIIDFIESLENKSKNWIEHDINLVQKFNEYKNQRMQCDLKDIIKKYALNENETRKYMNDSFENGELKTIGINIEKILPKISRFNASNERYKVKKDVISALANYFENYFYI